MAHTRSLFVPLLLAGSLLALAGCYTQYGATEEQRGDEQQYGEYNQNVPGDADSVSAGDYSDARSHFYFNYYYPWGVSFGFGYYDPWYAYPYWSPYSYYGGYYPGYYYPGYYYPYYGSYYGAYCYTGTARHTGTTRSSGYSRTTGGYRSADGGGYAGGTAYTSPSSSGRTGYRNATNRTGVAPRGRTLTGTRLAKPQANAVDRGQSRTNGGRIGVSSTQTKRLSGSARQGVSGQRGGSSSGGVRSGGPRMSSSSPAPRSSPPASFGGNRGGGAPSGGGRSQGGRR